MVAHTQNRYLTANISPILIQRILPVGAWSVMRVIPASCQPGISCVCSDKAWCPLATVNVDSIILPHGKSSPVGEMGTIKFSLESPSSVSTPHCPKLETYGICEAMCFARAYRWLQYLIIWTMLDSIPLSRINVYYQSGEKTSPNGNHSCNVVTSFI